MFLKKILVALTLLMATGLSAEDFSQLEDKAFFWNSSYNYCQAQTVCPNGEPIYCQVYGSAMTPFGAGQACQWMVFPGQAVRCSGYVQQFGPFGAQWIWADLPVSCF
jgi:hypothetical protein